MIWLWIKIWFIRTLLECSCWICVKGIEALYTSVVFHHRGRPMMMKNAMYVTVAMVVKISTCLEEKLLN